MTGREGTFLRQALEDNYINEGPMVGRFEEALAERLGVKHVVCTTSGTAAIFLALKAVGVGMGDAVVVPDVTFIATANAAFLTGAAVVLAPVDERFLMVPVAYEQFNVPVNVSGRLALVAPDSIEDSCESFPIPPRGLAACYSFSPNKIVSTGQGGCIATNNAALARAARMFKDQGRVSRGTGGDDEHLTIGFNLKMTDLQAAVGLAQLEVMDTRIARLRRNHQIYQERLGDRIIPFHDDELPLWTDLIVTNRDGLDAYLTSRGMQARRYWHPLHNQEPYKQSFVENRADDALWLPSSFTLTDEDVERVCAAVIEFCG